ncbi:hypothetical protein P692DRAFT_201808551 [Suillus brevipes Sb2]|nr:hypothetical protein P692DRAFT_201808551 [Suillus brevipes Sb2]
MPPQPPIKLFCYILGGDSPGIKTKWVSRALQSASGILVEWDRFYPVVYGRHVGIYLHWDDVVPEVNGREIRRFQCVETFLDSLTYMIMKGAYSSVSSLPPVAGMDAGPSFGSLSRPISSNVLLSRPKIGESNSFNVSADEDDEEDDDYPLLASLALQLRST